MEVLPLRPIEALVDLGAVLGLLNCPLFLTYHFDCLALLGLLLLLACTVAVDRLQIMLTSCRTSEVRAVAAARSVLRVPSAPVLLLGPSNCMQTSCRSRSCILGQGSRRKRAASPSRKCSCLIAPPFFFSHCSKLCASWHLSSTILSVAEIAARCHALLTSAHENGLPNLSVKATRSITMLTVSSEIIESSITRGSYDSI